MTSIREEEKEEGESKRSILIIFNTVLHNTHFLAS